MEGTWINKSRLTRRGVTKNKHITMLENGIKKKKKKKKKKTLKGQGVTLHPLKLITE